MWRMLSILCLLCLCPAWGEPMDQLQAMQDAIDMLKRQMASMQHERDESILSLKSKMESMQSEKDNLKAEVAELKKLNQDVEKSVTKLDTGLNKAEDNIQVCNKKFDKLANGLAQKLPNMNITDYRAYDMSVLPLGTILPFLPTVGDTAIPDEAGIPEGWVECDGEAIREGPWMNLRTPNLNDADGGRGLFLRGGSTDVAGNIEYDAIQSHQHEDSGHTHTDAGHTHQDSGHTHVDSGHDHGGERFVYDISPSGPTFQSGSDQAAYVSYKLKSIPTDKASIQKSNANIGTSMANIQSGKALIGGPVGDSVRISDETRPANMRVVWIIKVQPAGWLPQM